MKVIILAGGKGTRLGKLTKKIPKPLIEVNKKSIIEYQIETMVSQGFKDFVITVNHLNEIIKNKLGSGERFGAKIEYFTEQEPLGSAGALFYLKKKLKSDFLIIYGDLLFNIDLKLFIKAHKSNIRNHNNVIGTIVTHPNNHPYDSDVIEIDQNNKITAIHKKPHGDDLIYHNLTNAAIYICRPSLLGYIKKNNVQDFAHDIFPKIIKNKKHKLYSYFTPEYTKDIGTTDRLQQAKNDLRSGRFYQKNLSNKQAAIFLDRDGTINKEIGNLNNIKKFEILKNSHEAIKLINQSNYLAIVITNQPMVAKGMMTISDVDIIHKHMETELGNRGAWLDAIYYCPHHPDKGFKGENLKYKIKCKCRKPDTELIKLAKKRFNISLKKSFFIGDSSVDAMVAQNSKMPFIGVKTGYGCQDGKYSVNIKILTTDLLSAVRLILKNK